MPDRKYHKVNCGFGNVYRPFLQDCSAMVTGELLGTNDVCRRYNRGVFSKNWYFYTLWPARRWDYCFSVVLFFANYSMQEGTFPFYWNYQNVYFSLFLSLISLACVEHFSSKSELRNDRIRAIVLQIISVAVIAVIAEVSCCDYGLMGIVFIVAFYVCRKNRVYQVLMFLLAYMLSTGNQLTIFVLFACVILSLYNGKRGKLKLKYAVYIFYPVHIIMLHFVTVILERMI